MLRSLDLLMSTTLHFSHICGIPCTLVGRVLSHLVKYNDQIRKVEKMRIKDFSSEERLTADKQL